MNKKSYKIAFGGIITALCLFLMFLTGMIPLGVYLFPAIAGLLILLSAIEIGTRWAYLCYLATALLSLLLTPDWEAKFVFIFIFGIYPTIKLKLDKMNSFVLRVITKFAVFNSSLFVAYGLLIAVLGMKQFTQSFGAFGKTAIIGLIFFANVFFVLYDLVITNMEIIYLKRFRKIFKKKF